MYLCFASTDCGKEPTYDCIVIGGLVLDDGTIEDVSDYSAFVNPNANAEVTFSSPNLGSIVFTQADVPDGVSGNWEWSALGGLLTGAMNITYIPEYSVFDLNFYSNAISVDYKYCKHYYQDCEQEVCEQ